MSRKDFFSLPGSILEKYSKLGCWLDIGRFITFPSLCTAWIITMIVTITQHKINENHSKKSMYARIRE